VTDVSITVKALVSIVYPSFHIETDGTNRICTATAGDGIGIEATTGATNGTWYVTQYDGPSGVQLQQVQVPVASTGGTLFYDDGGEPPGGYTNQWLYYAVSIGPPAPAGAQPLLGRNRFKFWLSHPPQPAGEITCYDRLMLPGNSGDRQYAVTAMQTVATMSSFTCSPVDFPLGVWTVNNGGGTPPITDLEQAFACTAMQASLSRQPYDAGYGTNSVTQIPSLPINNFFIMGEGATNGDGVALAVEIQGNFADTQLSENSLKSFGFAKTNALALAVFASCRVGDGSLMRFVLRNNDVAGQISSGARAQQHIRWCFGLGWKQDKSRDWQIYDYLSWWAFYSAYCTGSGFQYTLDGAMDQAKGATAGNGANGAVWSGCQGMTLDKTVP
jgi:hypothetical protein